MPPENRGYRPDRHRGYFSGSSGATFHIDIDTIPENKGAYALILSLDCEIECVVGRLGACHFHPGIYGYAGNAYGSGGLRARLRRHFSSGGSTHWHIDYLKPATTLLGAWVFDQGCECDVTEAMLSIPGASRPVDGFGASDCRRCRSHLVLLEE
jgi:Uri superfamily endonuclease